MSDELYENTALQKPAMGWNPYKKGGCLIISDFEILRFRDLGFRDFEISGF